MVIIIVIVILVYALVVSLKYLCWAFVVVIGIFVLMLLVDGIRLLFSQKARDTLRARLDDDKRKELLKHEYESNLQTLVSNFLRDQSLEDPIFLYHRESQ